MLPSPVLEKRRGAEEQRREGSELVEQKSREGEEKERFLLLVNQRDDFVNFISHDCNLWMNKNTNSENSQRNPATRMRERDKHKNRGTTKGRNTDSS
jgi:hypothetical protein